MHKVNRGPAVGHKELRKAVEDFLEERSKEWSEFDGITKKDQEILMKDGNFFMLADGRVMHICEPTSFAHGIWREDEPPNRLVYAWAAVNHTTERGVNLPVQMSRDWVGHCNSCEKRVPKRMRMMWFLMFALKDV